MMLVSIHNSSNWTDTVSCIDTCLQKTDLYRYKHEFVSIQTRENTFYGSIFIHSFIKHQTLLLLHEHNTQNPHFQIFNLPQTQPKLTKLDPKPLQIHYPFTFLHQFRGSSFIISTFKTRVSSIFVCEISSSSSSKFKVIRSIFHSPRNGTKN